MKLRTLCLAVAVVLIAACNKAPPAASTAASSTAAAPTAPVAEEKVLNIYNWSDYIGQDTIKNFEKETGIKVTYDVFDSNEILEAKLVSGNTGYDLVVPSIQYLARQVQAGVFQPLDRSKLSNWSNLDPEIMARIAKLDPGNAHAVNWQWGTTGIGYNVAKVKAALGPNAPVDSWDLIFKPENISKLKGCGVAVLDTPQEIMTAALKYLGEDPNSFDEKVIRKGEALLTTIRPYITEFNSSEYINELANGDICVAVGWSGDVFQAASRAKEAKNGIDIRYNIPKEGAAMWFDMMAIPADAKHPNNAHLFLNYIMRPEVMAGITNAVKFPNGNRASLALIEDEIKNDPALYPDTVTRAKLHMLVPAPPETARLMTRLWTRFRTGR